MYTKAQVDEMLSQVELEFEKTLGSIAKNEEETESSEVFEEELSKSESESESEEESFETIDELYGSMEKNEIEAHYNSIKSVMFGKSEEEEKEEEKEEDKEEEDKKKEKKVEKCGDMLEANKSEKNLIAENEELKKNLSNLNDLIGKLFASKKAPSQKAITGANYIAKSEEENKNEIEFSNMSKNEITSKLKSLDYSSLNKNDRDAINSYCLENASVESIKHLIK